MSDHWRSAERTQRGRRRGWRAVKPRKAVLPRRSAAATGAAAPLPITASLPTPLLGPEHPHPARLAAGPRWPTDGVSSAGPPPPPTGQTTGDRSQARRTTARSPVRGNRGQAHMTRGPCRTPQGSSVLHDSPEQPSSAGCRHPTAATGALEELPVGGAGERQVGARPSWKRPFDLPILCPDSLVLKRYVWHDTCEGCHSSPLPPGWFLSKRAYTMRQPLSNVHCIMA